MAPKRGRCRRHDAGRSGVLLPGQEFAARAARVDPALAEVDHYGDRAFLAVDGREETGMPSSAVPCGPGAWGSG